MTNTLAKLVAFAIVGILAELHAFAAPFAYITNETSNDVSVVDTATNSVVATVPAGTNPFGVAINPVAAFAYVTNVGSNSVSVIDTGANAVVATVPVGAVPRGVAVHPAGTFAYVANQNSGNVSVIGTATNVVVATVAVGNTPGGVAVNPAGTLAYVTNEFSNDVSVISTAANAVVATVPVGTNPFGVAVSPGGTLAYVANAGSNNVSVIDTATNSVVATVPVGAGPTGVAVNPAGTFVYVTNQSTANVSVIGTATNTVVATVPVGPNPAGVGVDPTGAFAYVAYSAGVAVINTGSNSVAATVVVGSVPIAFGLFIGGGAPPVIDDTIVTNTNDSGTGSLRNAISFVNANCAGQTISFNIPGAGHTISPTSPLPVLACNGMSVDGYTQPGSSPNTLAVGDNAVLQIELDGTSAGGGNAMFDINAASVTIRGLVINRYNSAFTSYAIAITAPLGTAMSRVLGCFIGTDPSGTVALGNYAGIGNFTGTAGVDIGGAAFGDRNVISGNLSSDINLYSGDGVQIRNNYVGTNAAGTAAVVYGVPYAAYGIHVAGTNTIISGNLVSGHSNEGIIVEGAGNYIGGNFIGTDVSGTVALGNTRGVDINSATNTYVGGTAGDGNVISGNGSSGGISVANSGGTVISGNFIGTDKSGTLSIPNGGIGIRFDSGAAMVGGNLPQAGNIIANNSGFGVEVYLGVTGVAILGNSIHGNAGRGIDFGFGLALSIDNCDGDTGPNNKQNFPLLASASSAAGATTIVGSLNSTASSSFRVEFFSSPASDSASNTSGRRYLGFAGVTTDGTCNGPINVTLPVAVAGGDEITATATDAANNTSWFSNAVVVTAPVAPPSPSITLTPASLAFAARTVSTASSPQVSTLANLGPGALTIASMTSSGDYAFTSTCATSLAAGASCDITVTFTPIAAGARNGSITITSDAAGGPHVLALSGTGQVAGVPGIQLSPASVTFGPQPVGSESALQFVLVTNDGTAPLTLNSITATGDFIMTLAFVSARGPCGASLDAGASCEIGIAFRSAAEGLREGSLDIASNAPGGMSSVHLVGTGQSLAAPRALSVPEALVFGAQRVGTRSAGSAARMGNNLTSTVSIIDLAASGDFSVSDTCTTIAPGAICSPLVFFQPTALGDRAGALTIRTLGETEPYVVRLSGIGAANGLPELSVSVTRIGFGDAFVGSAQTLSVNLSNIGLVAATVRSISIAGGDFFAANECATLGVGATCIVHVTFVPRAPGRQNATLQIVSDAEAGPLQVQVSGVGCYIPSVMRARQGIALCGP